jgi:hypothetical protein
LRNFRVGWDGALYGGSSSPWSIDAGGKAKFSYITASSGSLSYMSLSSVTVHTATITDATITTGTIGGCTISDGGITCGNWTLSSAGLSSAEEGVGVLTLKSTNVVSVLVGSRKAVSVSIPEQTISVPILGGDVTIPAQTATSSDEFYSSIAYFKKQIKYYGIDAPDGNASVLK